MVGVFTNQSYKPNIGGAASLKHQQWLKISVDSMNTNKKRINQPINKTNATKKPN